MPVRARHDGWTVEKQIAFIEALAETGVVEEACRRVGMSRTFADNLRRRPCGMQFRQAWEAALDYSLYRIEEEVFGRARHGVARPVFYRGEQVGEYRHFDERLTMFLLRTRRPKRYGRWIDKAPAPAPDPDAEDYVPEDPGIVLDGGLTDIEFYASDVRWSRTTTTLPLPSMGRGRGWGDVRREAGRPQSPPPNLPHQGGGDERSRRRVCRAETHARALRSQLSQLPAKELYSRSSGLQNSGLSGVMLEASLPKLA